MKKRLKEICYLSLFILVVGILYYIWGEQTGLYLPCMFYKITGLYCPGCGMTRMLIQLLHGNIKSAFYYNRLLFFLIPILTVFIVILMIQYVKKGTMDVNKKMNNCFILFIIFLIIFGILRNLPSFSFLAPIYS
ncbi:DUF2752 domain-containing protein [Lachnospiraceae bacterium WCA-693-APC-MOT-I]|uniref:DUF2752 domain-containing protein n=2 Tax=Velocimicrobium porci TaxID=2606634 RepID=A0A6L5XW42_9FIRM|nr:DUF2752 domain-containing protein [Velocimicrobium porci]